MRRQGTGLRLRGLFTVLALVASLLTSVAVASSASASDSGTLVSSINSARRSAGLAALSSNSSLSAVARSWAAHMASTGQLAHNPRLGSQVSGWRALGENVGVGGSASSIHSAFMGSSAHRANILSSRYTQVGVGVVSGGGQLWVVEVFRQPSGATTSSTSTKTTTKPRTTTRTTVRSKSASRTTSRTTAKVTKPAAKAPAKAAAARSVPAVPALDRSPLTLGDVLNHVRLAMTGSGDAVGAWAWLLRHLIGLRTTIGA
jgi:hypothetical protein